MKIILSSRILLFVFVVISCNFSNNKVEEVKAPSNLLPGECPEHHTDEVIPIVYGEPSEELFQKSDSGLVYLAGCEIPRNKKEYFCKKHQIEF